MTVVVWRQTVRAAGMALLAVVVAACGALDPSASADVSASPSAAARTPTPEPTPVGYRLGLSAPGVDGWHQALVCSARAEARTTGRVTRLTVADRQTDAAGQVEDIRNLVATGVDGLVIAPRDPAAVADAASEAVAAGLTVVAVGRPIDVEGVISIALDQVAFGRVGATWLVEAMGGKGDLLIMRGVTDDPVDAARYSGLEEIIEASPDIKVVLETQTEGDPALAVEQVNALLATDKDIDGIWTNGIDRVVVDALKTAEESLVPVVGSDRASFVSLLRSDEDLVGAAVTDPPSVGGAGVAMAIEALDGSAPSEPVTRIAPDVWANDSDAGKAALADVDDPEIDPEWPLSITSPGHTTYDRDEFLACRGPGE